jgi:Ubiquitin carboxyl-terminal hydrolase
MVELITCTDRILQFDHMLIHACRPVSYPLELRLPDSYLGAAARSDAAKHGAVYRLFAVIQHFGGAGDITAGHYTAIVRHASSWKSCDDR